MKKIFLTIFVLICCFNYSFSQAPLQAVIKSEIKFLENKNTLKQQRNSTVEFLVNKKTKKNEIKLTINRIMRNVSLSHVESFDVDTVRYEEEGFTVDTDTPIPKGEHDKSLIENLVTFTDRTITFQEDAFGVFVGPKVRGLSPNIENMFFSKIPALNKNNFLTPLILNINASLNSKIDTVISDSYQGIFITSYTKIENGYEINGKFVPLKTTNVETDPNAASTIYEFFNYSGKIKSNGEKIQNMELNIHIKSRIIFRAIQLNESKDDKYKIIVNNN